MVIMGVVVVYINFIVYSKLSISPNEGLKGST